MFFRFGFDGLLYASDEVGSWLARNGGAMRKALSDLSPAVTHAH